jgi:pimeloyl-ACP methyl ester carboxylesterase
MHVECFDGGPQKICIVPGLFQTVEIFKPLADLIKEKFSVTIAEIPSMMDIIKCTSEETTYLGRAASILAEYLKKNEIQFVFANSFGGSLALRMLSKYPQLCERVVLCNPPYQGLGKFKSQAGFLMLLHKLSKGLPTRFSDWGIRAVKRLAVHDPTLITEAMMDGVRDTSAEFSSMIYQEMCKDKWRINNVDPNTQFELLVSENDRLVNRKHIELLKQDLNCEMTIIPQAGHTAVAQDLTFISNYLLGV